MQKSTKTAVLEILNEERPRSLLDAPCGDGWLRERVSFPCEMDGVDLYERPDSGYRRILAHNLDSGLPDTGGQYDCVACCEGIEHFGNPLRFFEDAWKALTPGGLLIVATPNTWYPQSRLQFLMRGFFPGFPCLAGRIERGSHMHIMPWSWPQLHLYLKLANFEAVELRKQELSHPKHFWEPILGLPQRLYCRHRLKRSKTDEERLFWATAGSEGSVLGRHLLVTARKPGGR